MRVLTELYTDSELACIREYATNALDSHREAGQTRPIEVETPGLLSPYLRIRDFGIGMTVSDIEEIYSRYGASTKRESNGVTGMLGVGCKSALAYTSQFTLVARRDGAQCTVAISRDEDGGGSMTVVDTCGTNEPNGVEVVIPARAINEMDSKAADFFKYWEPGLVLLNGREPKRIEGLVISPDMTLVRSALASRYGGYSKPSVIIMGNVPYPASEFGLSSADLDIPYTYNLVARVPIGSVDFAPSREHLQDTKETRAAVGAIRDKFKVSLRKVVTAKIAAAESPLEAVRTVNRWSPLLGTRHGLTFDFRGTPIPPYIDAHGLTTTATGGRGRSSAGTTRCIGLESYDTALFVTDFEPEKMSTAHKDKLLSWIEVQGFTEPLSSIVLCRQPLDTYWLNPKHVVAWETIKAIKLARAQSAPSGRIPGSYDIAVATKHQVVSRRGVPGSELDQTKPIFWAWGRGNAEVLARFHSEFTLVRLSKNRIAKWRRDVPTSVGATEEIERLAEGFVGSLAPDLQLAVRMRLDFQATKRNLMVFPLLVLSEIHDPKVRDGVRAAHANTDEAMATLRLLDYPALPKTDWTDPLDKYPLLINGVPGRAYIDAIDYMNWLYDSRQP